MRKNRLTVVHSALDQPKASTDTAQYNPNERITNFFNTIDAHDLRNFTPSRETHSIKHSRGMTLNFNSPRGLKINSKEIHLLKYVDLSEADKIKDYFKNSKDLGPKDLKNVVHLEFCRKSNPGKLQRYSGKKTNNKRKEEFFQPWESIDRDEEILNDQFIKREI